MYLFIAKALLGKLPSYTSNLLIYYTNTFHTLSDSHIRLKVPRVLLEFGKSPFVNASWFWNEIQNVLNLDTLPTLTSFKHLLLNVLKDNCNCFF